MDGVPDRDLVDRARRGSSEAAATLFERHWGRAWQVAFTLAGDPQSAEDVVQDAFERAFARLPQFNGRSSFGTWLHRIVVNRALDVARRERRLVRIPPEVARDAAAEPSQPLESLVRRLPPERRTPLVLRYWLDFAPREIAEILGVPVERSTRGWGARSPSSDDTWRRTMTTDFEDRLRRARPLVPPAGPEAQARLRRAALDALPAVRPTPRGRRGLRLALALAAVVAGGASVAGALGIPGVRDTLDRLGAWAQGAPGEPSPPHQAAFERENAASYARFPAGTKVGLVARRELAGERYELLGFRDGSHLCLRLVTSLPDRRPNPAECVPAAELERLEEPLAVLGGHVGRDGRPTVVFGLAGDAVVRVEVAVADGAPEPATVAENAFLYVDPDAAERSGPEWPAVRAVAFAVGGRSWETRVETGPSFPGVGAEALPGPSEVERILDDGRIAWLERGEARGRPFAWAGFGPQRLVHARAFRPDPRSSFEVAVAFASGTSPGTEGGWYCLAWLWPLVELEPMSVCTRDDAVRSGFAYMGAWPSSLQQFPLWVGMAADEVETLELYSVDGTRSAVPIVGNVFAFRTRKSEPAKLVARDREGRVVKVGVVGGSGSGIVGMAVGP